MDIYNYQQKKLSKKLCTTIAFLPLSNLTKSEVFCKLSYGMSPK